MTWYGVSAWALHRGARQNYSESFEAGGSVFGLQNLVPGIHAVTAQNGGNIRPELLLRAAEHDALGYTRVNPSPAHAPLGRGRCRWCGDLGHCHHANWTMAASPPNGMTSAV